MCIFFIIFFAVFAIILTYSLINTWNRTKRKNFQAEQILSDKDRLSMAFHEAGHAIVYAKLFGYKSLYLVTIDPNEKEFGSIKYTSDNSYNQNINELISLIAVSLAGGISERYFLKEKTTSLIHDLKNAKFIALEMVSKFGMGEKTGFFQFENFNEISEQMKSNVENDILVLLKKSENLAYNIISKHYDETIRLKDLILLKGTLLNKDISIFFTENKK